MHEPLYSNFLFSLSHDQSSIPSCFGSVAFACITSVLSGLRGKSLGILSLASRGSLHLLLK